MMKLFDWPRKRIHCPVDHRTMISTIPPPSYSSFCKLYNNNNNELQKNRLENTKLHISDIASQTITNRIKKNKSMRKLLRISGQLRQLRFNFVKFFLSVHNTIYRRRSIAYTSTWFSLKQGVQWIARVKRSHAAFFYRVNVSEIQERVEKFLSMSVLALRIWARCPTLRRAPAPNRRGSHLR